MTRVIPLPEAIQHQFVAPFSARVPLRASAAADPARFEEIGRVICESFPRRPGGSGTSDYWTYLLAGAHLPLVEMIESERHAAVAAHISNLTANGLGYGLLGIGDVGHETQTALLDPAYRSKLGIMFLDGVVSVAEAFGLLDLENPEDAAPTRNLKEDAELLLQKIDARIGCAAELPRGFSGAYGIARPRGGVCEKRALSAVYASERILQLLKLRDIPPADAHVLEIGGGVGTLAYLCAARGIGRYTIVDLPTVRAIQIYMALYNFPDRAVATAPDRDAPLCFLTPEQFGSMPDRSVHVVVNENSIPEMGREIGLGYLQAISRIAIGFFLSINHESRAVIAGHPHTVVRDLAREVPRLAHVGRARHWVNRGYVEDLFAIEPAGA